MRMLQAERKYLRICNAVLTLQRFARGALVRRREAIRQQSALALQIWWRAVISGRQQRQAFLKAKAGVVVLQSLAKAGQQRSRYLALRSAVVNMQRQRRQIVKVRTERSQFLEMRSAAVVLQARWRGLQARPLARGLRELRDQTQVPKHPLLEAWRLGGACRPGP